MNGNAIVHTLGIERPDPSWQTLGIERPDLYRHTLGIDDLAIRNVSNSAVDALLIVPAAALQLHDEVLSCTQLYR